MASNCMANINKNSKSLAQYVFKDLEENNLLSFAGSSKIKLRIWFYAFPNMTIAFVQKLESFIYDN